MPPAVRSELERQLEPYRRAFPDVRWTHPRTWHLTLLFLGAVRPQRTPELEALVEAIAREVAAYRVLVDLGGGRPRHGHGVAWLGASTGATELIEAATFAAAACPADITDGAPPKRTPAAHLTVARKADERAIEAVRAKAHGPLEVGWMITHVELVRSHLEPGGARYETLHQSTM